MGAIRADPADLRGQVNDHVGPGVAEHTLDVREPAKIVVAAPQDNDVAAAARLERLDDPRAEQAGAAGHEHASIAPASPGRRAHAVTPVRPAAVGDASWRSLRIFSRGTLSRASSAACCSGWSKAATMTPSNSSLRISPIARTGKPRKWPLASRAKTPTGSSPNSLSVR